MSFPEMLIVAGNIAMRKTDEIKSFLLGAVAVRTDGAIVHARNGSAPVPEPDAHAEARVCKKSDWGATVYVARIRRDSGQFGMARPCKNCQLRMRRTGIKKCYYTISSNEFGVIIFNSPDETFVERTRTVVAQYVKQTKNNQPWSKKDLKRFSRLSKNK